MRNISFALTTRQVRDRTKTVTRRMGWLDLKPGELLCAVVKGMGLKPGEKIERICVIRVASARRERLDRMLMDIRYGFEECRKEGFPKMNGPEFVEMFCHANKSKKCKKTSTITRIEFEYVTLGEWCDHVDGTES